jgi:hypothetical protein
VLSRDAIEGGEFQGWISIVSVEKCIIALFLNKKLCLDCLHRGAKFLENYGLATVNWCFGRICGA